MKLKIFAALILAVLVVASFSLCLIPYIEEEMSLNHSNLIANPSVQGATLSYSISGSMLLHNGDGTVTFVTPSAQLNVTNVGNGNFKFSLSIVKCNDTGQSRTKVSGIQGINGNFISYLINNLSHAGSFIKYSSLILNPAPKKIIHSNNFLTVGSENIRFINSEVAIENFYVPLNINNVSIQSNLPNYPAYGVYAASQIGFLKAGSYSVLSYMEIKGGNFSLANKLLGTNNKIVCGFKIFLQKSNIRFNLASNFYFIQYLKYMITIWIAGIIFLVLTVRQVRKRIRNGRLKS